MKCISLSRPWADLVVTGEKPIENRSWGTRERGLLVLHAAKSYDRVARDFVALVVDERRAASLGDRNSSPTGYLGVANLVDICERGAAYDECDCGPWAMLGSYHWRLSGARAFPEPIPGNGQLGLWKPPAEVREAVERLAVAP